MTGPSDRSQSDKSGTNTAETGPTFDRRMLDGLVCPQTQATLRYDARKQELISEAAGLAFPIRGGIPVMLVDEARQIDP